MTKWICNGRTEKIRGHTCHQICKCEMGVGIRAPTECLLDDRECTWRRDCTEEIGAAKFKMTYTYKELDKKVQDLITAGQGQMKRIQELERQVKALHSHRHETLVAHYGR